MQADRIRRAWEKRPLGVFEYRPGFMMRVPEPPGPAELFDEATAGVLDTTGSFWFVMKTAMAPDELGNLITWEWVECDGVVVEGARPEPL
jgi:hypothetical protein